MPPASFCPPRRAERCCDTLACRRASTTGGLHPCQHRTCLRASAATLRSTFDASGGRPRQPCGRTRRRGWTLPTSRDSGLKRFEKRTLYPSSTYGVHRFKTAPPLLGGGGPGHTGRDRTDHTAQTISEPKSEPLSPLRRHASTGTENGPNSSSVHHEVEKLSIRSMISEHALDCLLRLFPQPLTP